MGFEISLSKNHKKSGVESQGSQRWLNPIPSVSILNVKRACNPRYRRLPKAVDDITATQGWRIEAAARQQGSGSAPFFCQDEVEWMQIPGHSNVLLLLSWFPPYFVNGHR